MQCKVCEHMNTMINLQYWSKTSSFKDDHGDEAITTLPRQPLITDDDGQLYNDWVVVQAIAMYIYYVVMDHELLQWCLHKTK